MNRKVILSAAAAVLVQLLSSSRTQAVDYYFSPSGSDGNSGTSAGSAFASLSKISTLNLQPGDNIKLLAGAQFTGNVTLPSGTGIDAATGNAAGAPIKITTYGGSSLAVINAGIGTGISAPNSGNIEISNLRLVGAGAHFDQGAQKYIYDNTGNGIEFINHNGKKNDHVVIKNVVAEKFGQNGVWLGASGQGGFKNISISNVIASENQLAGIATMGDPNNGNRDNFNNLTISQSAAFKNYGRDKEPNKQNSGSGIVIGQVKGGTIERSVAYGNGVRCDSIQGGPVGIWAWDSDTITIQHNESYNNGTAGQLDGGGFDLDGGVVNSVIQYNYSHGNDGAGYLLAQYPGAKPMGNNTIRYNISQNDGRKNDFGAIHIWADVDNTNIYNNTIFVGPSDSGTPSAVRFHQFSGENVRLLNNLLMVDKAGPGDDPKMISLTQGPGGLFDGNAYWNDGESGIFNPADLRALYLDLARQHKLHGPAGQGPTLKDAQLLDTLVEYTLNDDSPLIDRGINLLAQYGIDPGGYDFYGLNLRGDAWDIGASENQSGAVPTPEPVALGFLSLGATSLLRRRRPL
ncbi:MAG TPA: right-handed parallel beta-helix repeat-containing protein [Tepidisphaeraceae bacterium]